MGRKPETYDADFPEVLVGATAPGDPDWNSVELLLPLDTDFTDISTSTHTVTANGDAAISTAQIKFGAGSMVLDGSGDFLRIPSSSDFVFGTGDFTVELWCYSTNNIDFVSILENRGGTNAGDWMIGVRADHQLYVYGSPGGAFLLLSGTTLLTENVWHHIAYTHASGTHYLFIDGVLTDSATPATPQDYTETNDIYVGAYANGAGSFFYGYIYDLRITKGVARYLANFTPLTAVFPIGAGNDSDWNSVELLLPLDTDFTDASTSEHTVTAGGNAAISTAQIKFGAGSVALDGSGDYLSIPSSSDFAFGTGDFTVEMWCYSTNNHNWGSIVDNRGSNNSGGDWVLGVGANHQLYVYGDGAFILTSGTTLLTENAWHHIAYMRDSGTHYLFIDGVLAETSTTVKDYQQTNNIFVGSFNGASEFFYGYIDDLRITKGVARYTPNFTPPTEAFLGSAGSDGSDQVTGSHIAQDVTLVVSTDLDATLQSTDAGEIGYPTGNTEWMHLNMVNATGSAQDFTVWTYNYTFGRWTELQIPMNFVGVVSGGDPYWDNVNLLLPMDSQSTEGMNFERSEMDLTRASVNGIVNYGNNNVHTDKWGNPGQPGGDGVAIQIAFNQGTYADINIQLTIYGKLSVAQTIHGVDYLAGDPFKSVTIFPTYNQLQNASNNLGYSYGYHVGAYYPSDNEYAVMIPTADGNHLITTPNYVFQAPGAAVVGDQIKWDAIYAVSLTDAATGAAAINPYGSTGFIMSTDLSDPYWDDVVLLLPMDTDFTDATNTHTVTANGAAAISTAQKKFGTGSVVPTVSASTGFLTIPSDSGFVFGTGDFTVELWCYSTNNVTYTSILENRGASNGGDWMIGVDGNHQLYVYSEAQFLLLSGTTLLTENAWHHIAYTRDSGTHYLFMDGVLVDDTTPATPRDFTDGNDIYVGAFAPLSVSFFYGYIDDIRITKGVARYTANFTPPTAAFPIGGTDPEWSNVSLLLPLDTDFTDESTNTHTVTAGGNAAISTAQIKFGAGSVVLGVSYSTGFLTIPTDSSFVFGTGDFTVELWCYSINNQNWRSIVENRGSNNTGDWMIGVGADHQLYVYGSPSPGAFLLMSGTTLLTENAWHHIAYTCAGGTHYLFIDGVLVDDTTPATLRDYTETNDIYVGAYANGLGSFFTGYIDDLRITKGVARYTANFTPPTAAAPLFGVTGGGLPGAFNNVDEREEIVQFQYGPKDSVGLRPRIFGYTSGNTNPPDAKGTVFDGPVTVEGGTLTLSGDTSIGTAWGIGTTSTTNTEIMLIGKSTDSTPVDQYEIMTIPDSAPTGSTPGAFSITTTKTWSSIDGFASGLVPRGGVITVEGTLITTTESLTRSDYWKNLATTATGTNHDLAFTDGNIYGTYAPQPNGKGVFITTYATSVPINSSIIQKCVIYGKLATAVQYTRVDGTTVDVAAGEPYKSVTIFPTKAQFLDTNGKTLDYSGHNLYNPYFVSDNPWAETMPPPLGTAWSSVSGIGCTPLTYDFQAKEDRIGNAIEWAEIYAVAWYDTATGETIPEPIAANLNYGRMHGVYTDTYTPTGTVPTAQPFTSVWKPVSYPGEVDSGTIGLRRTSNVTDAGTVYGQTISDPKGTVFDGPVTIGGDGSITFSGDTSSNNGGGTYKWSRSVQTAGSELDTNFLVFGTDVNDVEQMEIVPIPAGTQAAEAAGLRAWTHPSTKTWKTIGGIASGLLPHGQETTISGPPLVISSPDLSEGGDDSPHTVSNASMTWAIADNSPEKKFGAAAGDFSAAGAILEVPDSSDFAMGTGNFTIEGWFYANPATSPAFVNSGFFEIGSGGYFSGWQTNNIAVGIYENGVGGAKRMMIQANGVFFEAYTVPWTFSTWHHFAMVKNSGNTRLYLDGTAVTWTNTVGAGTYTTVDAHDLTPAHDYTCDYLGIGRRNIATQEFDGLIDDFRVTKGVARYTSNFTPSSDVPVHPIGTGNDSYWNNVSLLLPMDTEVSGAPPDLSSNTHTVDNAGGNWAITPLRSIIKKFGASSGDFTAAGALLKVPQSSDFALGAGEFTIEGWFYADATLNGADYPTNNVQAQSGLFQISDGSYLPESNTGAIGLALFRAYGTGYSVVLWYNGGNQAGHSGGVFNPIWQGDTWHHFAVVKTVGSGWNQTKIYIDGRLAFGRSNDPHTYVGEHLIIGGTSIHTPTAIAPAHEWNGLIDDFRITKGVARYISGNTIGETMTLDGVGWTAPTAAFPASAGSAGAATAGAAHVPATFEVGSNNEKSFIIPVHGADRVAFVGTSPANLKVAFNIIKK